MTQRLCSSGTGVRQWSTRLPTQLLWLHPSGYIMSLLHNDGPLHMDPRAEAFTLTQTRTWDQTILNLSFQGMQAPHLLFSWYNYSFRVMRTFNNLKLWARADCEKKNASLNHTTDLTMLLIIHSLFSISYTIPLLFLHCVL